MKFKPRFGRFKDSNVNPDEYMLRGFMSPEREARKAEFTTKLNYKIEKLKFEDLDALKKRKEQKGNKQKH